ncbi:unnamed protein product [Phytophthora fragariaefolia]|uniref:Unnamed protein product n=1 Tax=Phytophthora fragariaefolia TaxID=1490495 RepID=A0A9W6X385_9STRA|nr:unnamed protein product [Phytophthora fragariaefolia]
MDEFERAQAQAMELLLQQCAVEPQGERQSAAANATLLDLLAHTCAEANAAVQQLRADEVAAALARAVAATQLSLRSVGRNVSAMLQDPQQMRELCAHAQRADAEVLQALQSSPALLEGEREGGAASSALARPADEENVRNMMLVAEGMCSTMDHALSTITEDELALAAQLSLSIAQKLLEAGQALFTSLGDEERRKVESGDRRERSTIEELEEEVGAEGSCGDDADKHKGQMKRAAVLRTYVADMYNRTREEAVEHPFLAGALTAAGLPFIGLAVRA